MIKIKQATKAGFVLLKNGGVANMSYPSSKTRRGRVVESGTICPTITANAIELNKIERSYNMSYKIRKLTPTECYVLMGMNKEDVLKAREVGVSNSSLYEQAGNGIVTNCVKLIFQHLYKSLHDENYICTDEDSEFKDHISDNKINITANVLFSGIGCQERGIENSGCYNLKVNCVSDISKEAVVSYAAIHCGLTQEMIDMYENYPTREEMAEYLSYINLGYDPVKNKPYDWSKLAKRKGNLIHKYWLACKLSNNVGDISKVQRLDYANLWTYSFPCTDISICGKQEGIIKNKTRSGLLYEVERLLNISKSENTLPIFLLLENVDALVSKKFIGQYNEWLKYLDDLGYNTYWQIINAKDTGIPQNRKRVFALSIRKDIDNCKFKFPKPFDSGLRLVDILEDEVEEKYFIDNEKSEKLIQELIGNGTLDNEPVDSCNVVKINSEGEIVERERESKVPTDLSINNPEQIEFANCIKRRYDAGISNLRRDGTGVVCKK